MYMRGQENKAKDTGPGYRALVFTGTDVLTGIGLRWASYYVMQYAKRLITANIQFGTRSTGKITSLSGGRPRGWFVFRGPSWGPAVAIPRD